MYVVEIICKDNKCDNMFYVLGVYTNKQAAQVAAECEVLYLGDNTHSYNIKDFKTDCYSAEKYRYGVDNASYDELKDFIIKNKDLLNLTS